MLKLQIVYIVSDEEEKKHYIWGGNLFLVFASLTFAPVAAVREGFNGSTC